MFPAITWRKPRSVVERQGQQAGPGLMKDVRSWLHDIEDASVEFHQGTLTVRPHEPRRPGMHTPPEPYCFGQN